MATDRLSVERACLEEVFLQTGEGVLVIDRWRRVIALNPAAERITGWTVRDIGQLSCRVLECQDERGRPLCAERCQAQRAIEERAALGPQPMRLATAYGTVALVEARYVPVLAPDDRGSRTLLLLRDLSAVQRCQERIADLQAEIAERALVWRGVVESLRTGWQVPVTTIRLAVNTLQRSYGAFLGPGGLQQLQRIATAVWLLEELILRVQGQARLASDRRSRERPPSPPAGL